MRFSVWPTLAQPWADVLEVTRHAEATGWDGVYVADHFMGNVGGARRRGDARPSRPPRRWPPLAIATERLRLGTLVLGNTYRHPAVLANWAATVDQLSGGRLAPRRRRRAGRRTSTSSTASELPPPGERIDRFEEACQVWKGLLREPVTTFAGSTTSSPTPSVSRSPCSRRSRC